MIDKCPHCGGEIGYYIIETMRYMQQMQWDGEPWDCSELDVKKGKIKRCSECKKIVKFDDNDEG